ncbi:hypothetical protein ONA91_15600 [Micromonospora sp. DR5-3]|nr:MULTISPECIES: hypothetical protein [unclassified Micromonospora]MCW3815869.1 hypothetical protein [Micromonospora sp. DR5-3]
MDVGGVAGLRFGVRVEACGKRAAAVRREVPDDGPAVSGQERRVALVAAADEAEAFQLVQVAAHGSHGLAGVVGEAFLGGEGGAPGGVGVVGQADEHGEALWWDVGGVAERPRDSFNTHGGAESPMFVDGHTIRRWQAVAGRTRSTLNPLKRSSHRRREDAAAAWTFPSSERTTAPQVREGLLLRPAHLGLPEEQRSAARWVVVVAVGN